MNALFKFEQLKFDNSRLTGSLNLSSFANHFEKNPFIVFGEVIPERKAETFLRIEAVTGITGACGCNSDIGNSIMFFENKKEVKDMGKAKFPLGKLC